MVKAVSATLVTCDPSVMQVLKKLDRQHHFILQEIDERNALVSENYEGFIKEQVEQHLIDTCSFSKISS